MYYMYDMSSVPGGAKFDRVTEGHLFGSRSGIIAQQLAPIVPQEQSEPFPWHLPVEKTLASGGVAFVIDLKPRNKDPRKSLSLYQVRDVWGYSAQGWTPIMIRLRGLCVDGKPPIDDPNHFTVAFVPQHENVYTFLSCDGTVREGKLHGDWTAAPPSSTNSALLWPEPLRYFVTTIRQVTPGVV
jgi:hypothetical protein